MPELPDFAIDNSNLIKKLIILKNKGRYGSHHLTSIIALLKNYQNKAPRYYPRNVKRKSGGTPNPTRPDYAPIEPAYKSDNDEDTLTEFTTSPSENDENDINIDDLERLADQQSAKRFFAINLIAPDEVMHSLSLQNQLAKAAANNIFRREKQLTCEYRQLTQYEVTCLVEHCMSYVEVDDNCAYLLTSLLIGKNLEEIKYNNGSLVIKDSGPFKNHPVWLYKPNLPEHKVNEPLEILLKRSVGKVIMSLPQQLTQALSRLPITPLDLIQIEDSVQLIIDAINKEKHTRLTLPRIINYLSYFMNNHGVDATEIALLLGKSIQQEPGCSYYQVNVGQLLQLHQRFVKDVLENANQLFVNEINQPTEITVGSQLQVKSEMLVKMFALLHDRLSALRNMKWSALEEFHNLYTIYILNLLNLSTGHRPVRHPYETIDCFDLNAGTLYISDKESRSSLSARVIALPQLAIEQLSFYHAHLTNIVSYITNIKIETGKQIQNALIAEGPLFFFLNDLNFKAVTPANFDAYSSDILPLKLNWHRHFMRTWLRKNGIHGHLVDGWMGHINSGGDALGRYSGICMADLKDIATVINTLLDDELKIKAQAPWSSQ
ncbi:hypothetical protein [Aliiglaciecola sp. NS0011-25]|uniref:hypothetical protein n=1 Tax=Aliiglaciecola sp. NS0011-25 TaxID=3127654 RepID=UPI0031030890